MVKPIVAFHAEIPVVREDGGVVLIAADFDDWYSEPEVLAKLAGPFLAQTIGELVEWLEDPGIKGHTLSGIEAVQTVPEVMSCCIKSGTRTSGAKGWDERIFTRP